jgi:two-component system chemotaxis sensor kinase CheA
MLDAQQEAFREEANELLTELETSLLELEESPEDPEIVAQVFRAMHTIKGSGAMFGFDDISAFTHEVETVYDQVRNAVISVTKELVDLSLQARDQIKEMLDDSQNVDHARVEELKDAFRNLLPAGEEEASTAEPAAAPDISSEEAEATSYRIRFKPAQDIFLNGTNPVALLDEMRELGPCQVVAYVDSIPLLEDYDAEACYLFWDIILTTSRGIDSIRDVFIFVEDDSDIKIESIDADDAEKRIGDILVERGDVSQQQIDQLLQERKLLGEMLVDGGAVSKGQIESALAEQRQLKEVSKAKEKTEVAPSIRVPADKLDRLVDLVGEMVTIQSRLNQTAIQRDDSDLISIAEEVERLTGELRDNTLNIRMLPIGTTFSKFKRLVRDLSKELGKEIDLQTSGAETELDKTVIEKLNDPLVHLIRNSIDHGIEMPDDREAVGKPRQGTVHLAAIHSGDSVVIEITDDGKGLNKDAIRTKGIERGVISEADELTDQELYQLIFAAGFSTAASVTNVSGRGVGMDVVKRAIEALRGSIEIDSSPGFSTTIKIKIPLTLAIIESLLVSIGGESFVLPLAQVEECIQLTRADVENAHGRNLANVCGQLVPYLPLRQIFAIAGESPAIEQVVISSVDGQQIGFVVDHVIGEHQTVIKSLGRLYRDVHGVSGATILGDGSVALILDISRLAQEAALETAN